MFFTERFALAMIMVAGGSSAWTTPLPRQAPLCQLSASVMNNGWDQSQQWSPQEDYLPQEQRNGEYYDQQQPNGQSYYDDQGPRSRDQNEYLSASQQQQGSYSHPQNKNNDIYNYNQQIGESYADARNYREEEEVFGTSNKQQNVNEYSNLASFGRSEREGWPAQNQREEFFGTSTNMQGAPYGGPSPAGSVGRQGSNFLDQRHEENAWQRTRRDSNNFRESSTANSFLEDKFDRLEQSFNLRLDSSRDIYDDLWDEAKFHWQKFEMSEWLDKAKNEGGNLLGPLKDLFSGNRIQGEGGNQQRYYRESRREDGGVLGNGGSGFMDANRMSSNSYDQANNRRDSPGNLDSGFMNSDVMPSNSYDSGWK